MKLLKRSSGNKNSTFSSDDAVQEGMPGKPKDSKTKRKKFGLFKNKSKGDKKATNASGSPVRGAAATETSTPTTVLSADENVSNNMEVDVIPAGSSSNRPKTEEELKETLSWARNLLQQLNTEDTVPGPGGEAEGTELILPGTKYEQEPEKGIDASENTEEEEKAIQKSILSEFVTENDEAGADQAKPEETKPQTDEASPIEEDQKPAADAEATSAEAIGAEDQDAAVIEEKKDEEGDPRNESMVVEEEAEGDQPDDEKKQQPQNFATQVAVKVLSTAFSCTTQDAQNCVALPENISGILPNGCQPILDQQAALYKSAMVGGYRTEINDLDNLFDERSASEFLHGMLNVGYTLIYHISVDDETWVGRTVNLIFVPGVCSARKVVQPVIEWNTMVGGKSNFVETKKMGLLEIDAISTSKPRAGEDDEPPAIAASSLPLPAKPPINKIDNAAKVNTACASASMCSASLAFGREEDEFDCFFTITTQSGEIHLFEALNSEDCSRIVAGIRYNAHRLSRLVIEGDTTTLLSDFYDNSGEPEESRLPPNEVMNRISHALLDGL